MTDLAGLVTININLGIEPENLRQLLQEELQPLEDSMATVLENLAAIGTTSTQVDEAVGALASAFVDLAADVRAALTAAADPTVDEQVALDALTATLASTSAKAAEALAAIAALDAEVGDADGSDVPVPPPVP